MWLFSECFLCFLGRCRLGNSWSSLGFLTQLVLSIAARAECGAYLGRRGSERLARRTTHGQGWLVVDVVDGKYQSSKQCDDERSSAKAEGEGPRKVSDFWSARCRIEVNWAGAAA